MATHEARRRFGERVQTLRQRRGLTIDDLAHQIGVGPRTLSQWMAGEAWPRLDNARAIALALEVTIDDLVDDVAPLPGRRLQPGDEDVLREVARILRDRAAAVDSVAGPAATDAANGAAA